MTWLHDLVAGFSEVRDLREAIVLACRARDRAVEQRDGARLACDAMAENNVHLAHRLEQSELREEQWRQRWLETS